MNHADCDSRDCLAWCERGAHFYCDALTTDCPGNCGEEANE